MCLVYCVKFESDILISIWHNGLYLKESYWDIDNFPNHGISNIQRSGEGTEFNTESKIPKF